MKYVFAILLLSSLVLAEKLYARSLRTEWTKSGMISGMSSAQAMNINGAKAAYKNSLGYIGNQKNSLLFGISFVAFKDAAVTNSLGISYNGQPKNLAEFANASGSIIAYKSAACLGMSEKTVQAIAKVFFETIQAAQKSGQPIKTVQRQFGVFNLYLGNTTVKTPNILFSMVISSNGVLGKSGWLEYCNPKQ